MLEHPEPPPGYATAFQTKAFSTTKAEEPNQTVNGLGTRLGCFADTLESCSMRLKNFALLATVVST